MATTKYTYWQSDEMWLGYLHDYPDYLTQGETLEDLKEHLLDLYNDLFSGKIPLAKPTDTLQVR